MPPQFIWQTPQIHDTSEMIKYGTQKAAALDTTMHFWNQNMQVYAKNRPDYKGEKIIILRIPQRWSIYFPKTLHKCDDEGTMVHKKREREHAAVPKQRLDTHNYRKKRKKVLSTT